MVWVRILSMYAMRDACRAARAKRSLGVIGSVGRGGRGGRLNLESKGVPVPAPSPHPDANPAPVLVAAPVPYPDTRPVLVPVLALIPGPTPGSSPPPDPSPKPTSGPLYCRSVGGIGGGLLRGGVGSGGHPWWGGRGAPCDRSPVWGIEGWGYPAPGPPIAYPCVHSCSVSGLKASKPSARRTQLLSTCAGSWAPSLTINAFDFSMRGVSTAQWFCGCMTR